MTSARVYVHPRCLQGPAFGALQASLEERGYDMTTTLVGPPSAKGHCELVRFVKQEGDVMTMTRMDGATFIYRLQPEGGRAA